MSVVENRKIFCGDFFAMAIPNKLQKIKNINNVSKILLHSCNLLNIIFENFLTFAGGSASTSHDKFTYPDG